LYLKLLRKARPVIRQPFGEVHSGNIPLLDLPLSKD